MAHKVLSKDMSDLVHAMKLVQKYFKTTVEAEYRRLVVAALGIAIYIQFAMQLFCFCLCRKMLSSAHVLAMDAKNLLDVVDNVRVRYPHINRHCIRQQHYPSQGSLSSHHESSSSGASSNASSLEKPLGASSHPPLEPVINED